MRDLRSKSKQSSNAVRRFKFANLLFNKRLRRLTGLLRKLRFLAMTNFSKFKFGQYRLILNLFKFTNLNLLFVNLCKMFLAKLNVMINIKSRQVRQKCRSAKSLQAPQWHKSLLADKIPNKPAPCFHRKKILHFR